jgi:hypothetical protein
MEPTSGDGDLARLCPGVDIEPVAERALGVGLDRFRPIPAQQDLDVPRREATALDANDVTRTDAPLAQLQSRFPRGGRRRIGVRGLGFFLVRPDLGFGLRFGLRLLASIRGPVLFAFAATAAPWPASAARTLTAPLLTATTRLGADCGLSALLVLARGVDRWSLLDVEDRPGRRPIGRAGGDGMVTRGRPGLAP